LTAQLCARLNSETRHSPGWDHLQFRMEEPDEQTPGRTIDLAAAPSGRLIWIDGRRYSQYQTLFPIECKRLPTPAGTERDEREYLHSRHGLRGGVQRFRASVHGGAHDHAALIGYLQTEDAVRWHARLQAWTLELAGEDWGLEEAPRLDRDDVDLGVARLSSFHPRGLDRPPIRLSHLWIQMTDGRRAATLQGVRLAPS